MAKTNVVHLYEVEHLHGPRTSECGQQFPDEHSDDLQRVTCLGCFRAALLEERCARIRTEVLSRPSADALNAALDRYARTVRRCTEARMLLAQVEGSSKRARRLDLAEIRCRTARAEVVRLAGVGGQDDG